jgi:hypothetical protein
MFEGVILLLLKFLLLLMVAGDFVASVGLYRSSFCPTVGALVLLSDVVQTSCVGFAAAPGSCCLGINSYGGDDHGGIIAIPAHLLLLPLFFSLSC